MPDSKQPLSSPRGIDIVENLADIHARIEAAAGDAGRPASEITLIAVTKTFAVSFIEAAYLAGQRIFGENRVQESEAKWPEFRKSHADTELHLIGPLQTNKVAAAAALFDVIETVDRPRLANALAKQAAKTGHTPDLYIQVNTGEEAQKAGLPPKEADAFIRLCRDKLKLPVIGLMCIPPQDEPPAPHFALLKKIADRNDLENLSMGMSADFDTAIAFGATHIRLGTVLFGERKPILPAE